MRYGRLCSVAHAMADSLASGICLMIGHYSVDVFACAARSPGAELSVDFLTGKVEGVASQNVLDAVLAFRDRMPEFCREQGVAFADFRRCEAVYIVRPVGAETHLIVEDRLGKTTLTEFMGTPLQRKRVLGPHGAKRRVPRKTLSDPG